MRSTLRLLFVVFCSTLWTGNLNEFDGPGQPLACEIAETIAVEQDFGPQPGVLGD